MYIEGSRSPQGPALPVEAGPQRLYRTGIYAFADAESMVYQSEYNLTLSAIALNGAIGHRFSTLDGQYLQATIASNVKDPSDDYLSRIQTRVELIVEDKRPGGSWDKRDPKHWGTLYAGQISAEEAQSMLLEEVNLLFDWLNPTTRRRYEVNDLRMPNTKSL